jgi:hypothetical protein
MEIIDQIKGEFEGENKESFVQELSGVLENQGLKVLGDKDVQGLFDENTKKAIARTHEALGKRGLEILKNENNEEFKYYEQPLLHIDKLQQTNTDLQNKLVDLEKAQNSGDPEKLKVVMQELSETRKLLKQKDDEAKKQIDQFKSTFDKQRKGDLVRNSLSALKFKEGIKPEELQSAQNFAIEKITNMQTQDREGVMVFIDQNGDALRNTDNSYKTAKDLIADSLVFMIDNTKPVNGLGGVANNNNDNKGGDASYIYKGEGSKADLIRAMKKWGTEKGIPWTNLRGQYAELAQTNNLK